MRIMLQRLLTMTSAVVCLFLLFGCGQARKEKRIPGTIEFETATGKDIAGMIIQYLERHAKPLGSKDYYEV